MSLRFILNGSTRVDSTTAVAAFPDVCTVLSWVYPTTIDATFQSIVEKTYSDFTDYRGLGINGAAGQVSGFIRRGSPGFTGVDVKGDALLVANKWQFVGLQMDATSSTATDQKIFIGNEKTPPSEIAAYSAQNAGSGAVSSGTGSTLKIANSGANDSGFPGLIHCVAIWNRKMDISEIRYWKLIMQAGRFKPSVGNVLFMYLGRDGGRQFDLSGSGYHGTITGALPVAAAPALTRKRSQLFGATVSAPPADNSGLFFAAV